jgi:hypothetical protein
MGGDTAAAAIAIPSTKLAVRHLGHRRPAERRVPVARP